MAKKYELTFIDVPASAITPLIEIIMDEGGQLQSMQKQGNGKVRQRGITRTLKRARRDSKVQILGYPTSLNSGAARAFAKAVKGMKGRSISRDDLKTQLKDTLIEEGLSPNSASPTISEMKRAGYVKELSSE